MIEETKFIGVVISVGLILDIILIIAIFMITLYRRNIK
jgi:hypothetical protein